MHTKYTLYTISIKCIINTYKNTIIMLVFIQFFTIVQNIFIRENYDLEIIVLRTLMRGNKPE